MKYPFPAPTTETFLSRLIGSGDMTVTDTPLRPLVPGIYAPLLTFYFGNDEHVETGRRPGSTECYMPHQRRHHICLDMGRMITYHTCIALMAEP